MFFFVLFRLLWPVSCFHPHSTCDTLRADSIWRHSTYFHSSLYLSPKLKQASLSWEIKKSICKNVHLNRKFILKAMKRKWRNLITREMVSFLKNLE